MPFVKEKNRRGVEEEFFQGKVDFVIIKEMDKPDQFGNTYRVTLIVDTPEGQKKGGKFISWGAFKEDRIRGDGRAISVQAEGEWYDLCAGFEIDVQVTRNGDWINPKIKTLVVTKSVDLPTGGGNKNSAPKGSKGSVGVAKRDNTGVLAGHAMLGAGELASRFGMDFGHALEVYHSVSRRVVERYKDTNALGLDDFGAGNAGGNAVNTAVKLIENPEDLEATANGLLDDWAVKLYEYIKNGTPIVGDSVDSDSSEEFEDSVPF